MINLNCSHSHELQLTGVSFNKAEHNRLLRRLLPTRTKGSIERKHQNISAVLIEMCYPYISGYKPLGNYQDLLRQAVQERLESARQQHFDDLVLKRVSQPVADPGVIDDLLAIVVPPPVREADTFTVREKSPPATLRAPTRRNFLELEARNASLGLAGEELVLQFEHERLWRAGKRHLADRIEHVARRRGDDLGYDILSFETTGRERLIEVKTTTFGVSTPFFVSANQVAVSSACAETFQLYRLFQFGRAPKLFTLSGALGRTCALRPVEFEARVA